MVQDVYGGDPIEVLKYEGFSKVYNVQTPDGWREVVRVTDSVCILLYDATNDRVLLVRQARAAMAASGNPQGYITEAVAGRFDKNLGPKALAIAEAEEEAGVGITEDEVLLFNGGKPMALSAGILTERSYLAFARVNPERMETEDRVFGVDEGEKTSRVWIPAAEFLSDHYECEDVRVLTFKLWFTFWYALHGAAVSESTIKEG